MPITESLEKIQRRFKKDWLISNQPKEVFMSFSPAIIRFQNSFLEEITSFFYHFRRPINSLER